MQAIYVHYERIVPNRPTQWSTSSESVDRVTVTVYYRPILKQY